MMTDAKAIKETANVHQIDIGDKENNVASSIGFYGDIDGTVMLVFPLEIAKKACELLIGETTDDQELILDTLAELVNIVGGKVKTLLGDAHISVDITLPRTYKDIKSFIQSQKGKKGIQVNFEFDNEPFYFYISNSY